MASPLFAVWVILKPAQRLLEVFGTVDGPINVTFSGSVSASEQDPDGSNNNSAIRIEFDDERDTLQEKLGCVLMQQDNSAPVYDPTLFIIVLVSLAGIVAGEKRNRKTI